MSLIRLKQRVGWRDVGVRSGEWAEERRTLCPPKPIFLHSCGNYSACYLFSRPPSQLTRHYESLSSCFQNLPAEFERPCLMVYLILRTNMFLDIFPPNTYSKPRLYSYHRPKEYSLVCLEWCFNNPLWIFPCKKGHPKCSPYQPDNNVKVATSHGMLCSQCTQGGAYTELFIESESSHRLFSPFTM